MPILPIGDENGGVRLPDDHHTIWALSHLPDEPDLERARRIVAARTMMGRESSETVVGLQLGELERVTQVKKDRRHRLIAYLILSVNLASAEHKQGILGYRRAGRLAGSSLSTVKRAWRRFSPVSHLIIGSRFNPHDGQQDEREWFLEYLAYSEKVRLLGESLDVQGQHGRSPLLDPEKTWKCPTDILLPSVDVSFDPLSDDLLFKLRGIET